MIPFFPQPLPDEIFYSLVARYLMLTGFSNTQIINQQLFGYSRVQPSILFPSRLNKFYETTKVLLDLRKEELLSALTPLTFFENFIDANVYSEIVDKIWGNGPSNINARMGLNPSRSCSIDAPKFCHQCSIEDYENYDQIYWHRVHQLPILVCPHHNIPLTKFELSPFEQNPYKFQVASGIKELSSSNVARSQNQLLKRIADVSLELLEGRKRLEERDFDYKARLNSLGYYKGKSIDIPKLIHDIYSKHKASEIQQLISGMSIENYFMHTIHKPSKIFDPARHLILQDFLEGCESQSSHKIPVFGNGPWPCLNKASDHFLKLKINKYSTRYETKLKQNVAIFECSCGMIYKKYFKSGPKKKEVTKIIEYGSTWESNLQELLQNNHSYYSISKILGIDIRLVKRKSIVAPIDRKKIKELEARKNHYRKTWSKLLSETNHTPISKARKIAPKIYKWLYRNDKGWLHTKNLSYVHKERDAQLRIDWDTRDKLTLNNLQNNYSILQQSSRRKITKSLLLNSVPIARNIPWDKVKTLMPKSSAFINCVKENTSDFQQRKISKTIDELLENRIKINRSTILVRAGLRNLTPQAEERLQGKLNPKNERQSSKT